ncbi:SOS response-associated peptidase, partial [Paracoccaceae bacterium]|nr:SOS response-associated peptidase [Paracoccaceae bacterium]
WLGEAGKGAATLMRPVADDVLDLQRVSSAINSNRATGPELWNVIEKEVDQTE